MLALIEGIPIGGMYQSMRQAESTTEYHQFLGFDRTCYVLADAVESIMENTRVSVIPHMKKGARAPQPIPYPGRPKKIDHTPKKATVADLFNKFRRQGVPVSVNHHR